MHSDHFAAAAMTAIVLGDLDGRLALAGWAYEGFWLPFGPPSMSAREPRFSLHARFLFLRHYWRGPSRRP